MHSSALRTFLTATAVWAAAVVSGCGDSAGTVPEPAGRLAAEHVDATILAESTLSDGHVVQLYRLADDGIAIREIAPEGAPTVLKAWEGKGSLLDFLHDRVPALDIPSSAVQAIDAPRLATTAPPPAEGGKRHRPKRPSSHALAPPSPPGFAHETQEPPRSVMAPAQAAPKGPVADGDPGGTLTPPAPQHGMSPMGNVDWVADAAAWTAAYCNGTSDGWGNTSAWFDGIWCPTNWGTAISGSRPTVDFEARGLNASFTAPATHWVEQWTGSAWNRFISNNLPPRYQSLWIFAANQTYRSGIEGERIDFSVRYRLQMPGTSELTDYPFDYSDWAYDFTDNMQGVAHDSLHWYFTNMMAIAKASVSTQLEDFSPLTYGMPAAWQAAGFNHMGDLVFVNGHLYVPMEGASRAIGVFNSDLTYVGYANINQDHAAWLAYNPQDGLFYSSSEYDAVHTLVKYRITLDGPNVSVVPVGKPVTLTGGFVPIQNLQGGEFSNKGNLYVSSDVAGGGLREIDVLTGFVAGSGHVTFSPGFSLYEELEGLTVWDLDNGAAPQIGGQIHLLMVDNDVSTDELYFKHFRVSPLSNL